MKVATLSADDYYRYIRSHIRIHIRKQKKSGATGGGGMHRTQDEKEQMKKLSE